MTTEVRNAIRSLNNKKASDEFGLTAEHLKFSENILVEEITGIFNQILQTKTVPDAFKSGILTPVLKKSKTQQCWTTTVVTVTPIIGKLFGGVLLPRIANSFE